MHRPGARTLPSERDVRDEMVPPPRSGAGSGEAGAPPVTVATATRPATARATGRIPMLCVLAIRASQPQQRHSVGRWSPMSLRDVADPTARRTDDGLVYDAISGRLSLGAGSVSLAASRSPRRGGARPGRPGRRRLAVRPRQELSGGFRPRRTQLDREQRQARMALVAIPPRPLRPERSERPFLRTRVGENRWNCTCPPPSLSHARCLLLMTAEPNGIQPPGGVMVK